jgi:hypothetical protein
LSAARWQIDHRRPEDELVASDEVAAAIRSTSSAAWTTAASDKSPAGPRRATAALKPARGRADKAGNGERAIA